MTSARLRLFGGAPVRTVRRGNTNAAAILIGEKGAELVLGREGVQEA